MSIKTKALKRAAFEEMHLTQKLCLFKTHIKSLFHYILSRLKFSHFQIYPTNKHCRVYITSGTSAAIFILYVVFVTTIKDI